MNRNSLSVQGKHYFWLVGWRNSKGIRLFLFLTMGLMFYLFMYGKLIPQTYDIQPNTISEKKITASKQMVNLLGTEKGERRSLA